MSATTAVPEKAATPTGKVKAGTLDQVEAKTEELKRIPIDLIVPSRTNPRKKRNSERDAELLDSVLRDGIIQPALLRPIVATAEHVRHYEERVNEIKKASQLLMRQFDSAKAEFGPGDSVFEIVAGERRWEASFKAGRRDMPAVVRELSDEQAQFLQIVENLQRLDISPVDEGRGFRKLLDSGKTAQQIADTVGKGKSVRYIYARAKLSELLPGIISALESGRLLPGHGDLLCRLQPEGQKRALRWIEEMEPRIGQAPVVRALDEWIKNYIHISLDSGPWKKDDATLVPEAGACNACQKNTAVNRDLFPEAKRAMCTDSTCFNAKMKAFQARVDQASREKEREIRAEGKANTVPASKPVVQSERVKSQSPQKKQQQAIAQEKERARVKKAEESSRLKREADERFQNAVLAELSRKATLDSWVLRKFGPAMLFEVWEAGLAIDRFGQTVLKWPKPKNGSSYDYNEIRRHSGRVKYTANLLIALMLYLYSTPADFLKASAHFVNTKKLRSRMTLER